MTQYESLNKMTGITVPHQYFVGHRIQVFKVSMQLSAGDLLKI